MTIQLGSAHDHDSLVVPLGAASGPGPDQLPGIEGFYVLSARGRLGRYDGEGRFHEDAALGKAMTDRIQALLRRYRRGDVRELAIGLVTGNSPDRPWRCASLVFSDAALREVFRMDNDPDAALTAFQKRNKLKSVYQGMELVLDAREVARPQRSRYCPVLFAPEEDRQTIRKRYGLEGDVEPAKALEVLDLLAPSIPGEEHPAALARMTADMRRARIAPELRQSSELMLVEESKTGAFRAEPSGNGGSVSYAGSDPWEGEPEARDTCCNDGDPVSSRLLAWFAPFHELNDLQRQFISRGHTVEKKRAGSTLIERGSEADVSIYLIEGTLELEAFDGRRMTIVGGTRRAHLPVSQLRPHAYTVKAATEVTLFRFSQVMVQEITRITTTYRSRPGIEVAESVELPDNVKALAAGSTERP